MALTDQDRELINQWILSKSKGNPFDFSWAADYFDPSINFNDTLSEIKLFMSDLRLQKQDNIANLDKIKASSETTINTEISAIDALEVKIPFK